MNTYAHFTSEPATKGNPDTEYVGCIPRTNGCGAWDAPYNSLGEWVDLGGMTSRRDEVSHAIFETASTHQSGERRTVRLKVEEGR